MNSLMKIQEKEAEIKAFHEKHYDSEQGFESRELFEKSQSLKKELAHLRYEDATKRCKRREIVAYPQYSDHHALEATFSAIDANNAIEMFIAKFGEYMVGSWIIVSYLGEALITKNLELEREFHNKFKADKWADRTIYHGSD